MKRAFFFVLLIVAMIAAAVATGVEETPTLTVLSTADTEFADGTTRWGIAAEAVRREYPNMQIEVLTVDLSDGSTLSMDALLAAGRPPNVYDDYIGRVSKYLVPEFALPLDEYINVAPFTSIIESFITDGHVYGLPMPGGGQAMAINLEIMSDIGYEVPDRWLISDFLEMAELVKQYYFGEKFATGMFAGNQSGDYLINNWFAAFGAEHYADGYGSTTIADNGAAVYEFFQQLVLERYIPPGAATLVDDDYVIQWASGDLAATAFFESWTTPYFNSVIDQGLRDEPFAYKFVPFPRAPGVGDVPGYMSFGALVVHNSDDEVLNNAAAIWAGAASGVAVQQHLVAEQSLIPTRWDIYSNDPNPRTAEISGVIAAGGVMDVGLTAPFFAAVRPTHYPVLQKVLNLQITPAAAIEEYEAAINEQLR